VSAPRTCPNCQLSIPSLEARFCERCGASLGVPDSPGAPANAPIPPPTPALDADALLRTLAAHPDLPRLLAATPETPELTGKTLPSVLLLLGLSVLGVFASLLCFQLCPPLGFVPLVLVVVGAAVVARQLLWNARTPLVARPAFVRELRAQVHAGARHSPDHTRHFALLQFDTDHSGEFECYRSALPNLEVGALGVAYLKGERIAAFTRVPVG
jgi:hypothetical protein